MHGRGSAVARITLAKCMESWKWRSTHPYVEHCPLYGAKEVVQTQRDNGRRAVLTFSLSQRIRRLKFNLHSSTPQPGSYTTEVVAANIPKGSQTFALVYSGALS